MPGCRERRPRRDRGGATGTVAASHGFASGMEARQGGDSSAGSVHDSPPRQGDARKRHKQENNKTDRNQGSSNQSQNRRKKRIIKGKVM
ncbi:pilus protein [Escherichia coli]